MFFHGIAIFPFPGKRDGICNFPGTPGVPGINLYLIKTLKYSHFLKNKKIILVGTTMCTKTTYRKYRKCQYKKKVYLKNPIPGNLGPISRKSGMIKSPGSR
jgi:hypothetical protein